MEAQDGLRQVHATVIAHARLSGIGVEAHRELAREALGDDAAERMAALAQLD